MGARGLRLGRTDIDLLEQYLPLQVSLVNDIEIEQGQRADAGRGQIERSRTSETATANQQHPRPLELELGVMKTEMQSVKTEVHQLGKKIDKLITTVQTVSAVFGVGWAIIASGFGYLRIYEFLESKSKP